MQKTISESRTVKMQFTQRTFYCYIYIYIFISPSSSKPEVFYFRKSSTTYLLFFPAILLIFSLISVCRCFKVEKNNSHVGNGIQTYTFVPRHDNIPYARKLCGYTTPITLKLIRKNLKGKNEASEFKHAVKLLDQKYSCVDYVKVKLKIKSAHDKSQIKMCFGSPMKSED